MVGRDLGTPKFLRASKHSGDSHTEATPQQETAVGKTAVGDTQVFQFMMIV